MNPTETFKSLLLRMLMIKALQKEDEFTEISFALIKLYSMEDITDEEKKKRLEKLVDYAEMVVFETNLN